MTLRRHKITKLGDYRPASRLGLIAQLLVSSEKRIIMEMRLVSSRLAMRSRVHVSRYNRHSLQRVLDNAEASRCSGIAPGSHVSREGILPSAKLIPPLAFRHSGM